MIVREYDMKQNWRIFDRVPAQNISVHNGSPDGYECGSHFALWILSTITLKKSEQF